ncbi:hypothetical protein DFJ63DRAFT_339277 [Scheffersomyces coipomensis]|uniref:uncharacterized protein n=1 Tax=Scheffersomyces coipomensis TaxID=1788519 RepID=UPI00315CDA75
MDPDQPQFGRSYNNNTTRNSNSRRTNTNPIDTNKQQQQPQQQHFHEPLPSQPQAPQLQSQTYPPPNRPNLTTSNRFNNMFSPQPRPTSPFSHNSPSSTTPNNPSNPSNTNTNNPNKRSSAASSPNSNINFLLPTQRHTPSSIEQNVSYTRSFNSPRGTSNTTSTNIRRDSLNIPTPPLLSVSTPPSQISQHHQQQQQQQQPQESQQPPSLKSYRKPSQVHVDQVQTDDEDARFLRLAREALVATAAGANPNGSALVDPTIQDLLTRLQYAASPHGNPIGRGSDITTNQKGQLNIQGFYEQFPNLSNDIFQGDHDHPESSSSHSQSQSKPNLTIPNRSNHPSSNNDGWNFLIGEPLTYKVAGVRYNKDSPDLSASSSTNTNITPTTADSSGSGARSHSVHGLASSLHDSLTSNRSLSIGSASTIRKQSLAESGNETVRKFLCEKCSMSFRRSSDLKRHEKQHLTIPPNICELCGKGFARKDALKRHMGTLTCKRNADKKLYIDNLNYLRDPKNSTPNGGDDDDDNDHSSRGGNSGFDVSTF